VDAVDADDAAHGAETPEKDAAQPEESGPEESGADRK